MKGHTVNPRTTRPQRKRRHTAGYDRDIVTALIIILAIHGLIAFVCGFVFLSTLGA